MQFMNFLTDFADEAVVLPAGLMVALMLVLLGWRRGAAAWLAAVCVTLGAMLGLKLVFLACGGMVGSLHIHSPSGHTAAAAITYGGLAFLLGVAAPLALPFSAVAAALFGASRVILGEHSISEVVLGGLVGVAGVGLLLRLAGPRPQRFRKSLLVPVLIVVVLVFHGEHLHAEPTIVHLAGLLRLWPLSVCRAG